MASAAISFRSTCSDASVEHRAPCPSCVDSALRAGMVRRVCCTAHDVSHLAHRFRECEGHRQGGCCLASMANDRVRLAEREGFEPSVEFPLHTLSKRARSTTPTSLRFRINELRAAWSSVAQNRPSNHTVQRSDLYSAVCGRVETERSRNCVRPPNVPRSLSGVSSIAAALMLARRNDRGASMRNWNV